MEITDKILGDGEYYKEVFEKNVLYLHHTAGAHRADWVIATWETDDEVNPKNPNGPKLPRAVATAYVMGNKSTRDANDISYDGKMFRAFDDQYWAHHLGTTYPNNRQLNKNSVALEICNYGPLKKGADGVFYTYVNTPVPKEMVVELAKPFRGYTFYHAYTDKQIAATKEFILFITKKYPKIILKTPLLTVDGFELNDNAKKGLAGIYSHSNVRTDKFDLTPQPKMIEMLKEVCTAM